MAIETGVDAGQRLSAETVKLVHMFRMRRGGHSSARNRAVPASFHPAVPFGLCSLFAENILGGRK